MPFQHGSPRILKRMRRPAAAENNLERIAAWRAICPELTIRSTFIVGFPGETEADFEVLLQFLEEADEPKALAGDEEERDRQLASAKAEIERLKASGELGKLYYLSSARTNLGPIRMDVDIPTR